MSSARWICLLIAVSILLAGAANAIPEQPQWPNGPPAYMTADEAVSVSVVPSGGGLLIIPIPTLLQASQIPS